MTTGAWDEAVQLASESGKPMMLFFTGSDWCPWCVRLAEEILDTHEFADWAGDHVVSVEVDFPRAHPLPGDQRVLNETLKRQHSDYVKSLPTVLFTDSSGVVLGQLGYEPGGPAGWIQKASAIVAAPGE